MSNTQNTSDTAFPSPRMYQFSSVAESCLTLCDPMDCNTPGFPVHHQLPELAQTQLIKLVMLSNHLIFCCPLFLLPSIFPSIRVFSNELALHIRWPRYWNFSFSISPSSEYPGLISFTQTPVHRIGDAIQPSHPLSSPFPPAFNPSQHQGHFQ